jgi:Bacteroidetes VLRF1 release factor/Vms1-associating treble clef domain/Ankyrin repeat
MSDKAKILERLPIYSDEAILLLKQTLEGLKSQDQKTITSPQQTRYKSRYEDSSDEDDNRDAAKQQKEQDDDSVSTSSAAESDVSDVDDTVDSSNKSKSSDRATNSLSIPATIPEKPPRRKKLPKPTMDAKEREKTIIKHLYTLSCNNLPSPSNPLSHIAAPAALFPHKSTFDMLSTLAAETLQLATRLREKPIVVLFLRSGRFAGGVFQQGQPIVHRAIQKYTVRKGQGKAQSSQDSSKKANSMGSQLRRAGEEALKQEMTETMLEWKVHVDKADLIFVSCPKTMKKTLMECIQPVVAKDDGRIRRVPLDLGRPTFENICIIHEVLTCLTVREGDWETASKAEMDETDDEDEKAAKIQLTTETTKSVVPEKSPTEETASKKEDGYLPLTPLHIAAMEGNIDSIKTHIEKSDENIDSIAGPTYTTPLHMAAQASQKVDPQLAADCVYLLLVDGKADPCICDNRNRPPYFLASHDKVREAFRRARAVLGEDYCEWDAKAKVGPALTDAMLEERRQKDLEKKRKKRDKQKARKAQEKAEAQEAERIETELQNMKLQEENAKRIRDGLQPRETTATNVCDFCQTVCRGQRRSQMLNRLDYVYCSSECLQKHKRELMARAAMSRFGN